MTRLYVINVTPLYDDALFLRALALVSTRRREKTLRFRQREDAVCGLGAELLLRFALLRDFEIRKLPEISEGRLGKPYFAELPEIHFSISHSHEYAACLISDTHEVGVDIQRMQKADMRSAKRVFSAAAYKELETENERRDERFCELWVLHESAVKLGGGSVFDVTDTACSRLMTAPEGYKLAAAFKKHTKGGV